jgi:predicted nucleic acid-binding protein
MPIVSIVLDASTAILLAKIGLLGEVAESAECVMPETARREATAKEGEDTIVIRKMGKENRMTVRPSGRRADALAADFRLGAGEAETLALAAEVRGIAAVDDGPAIRAAKALGIPFAATIHFLVRAREAGTLSAPLALELLDKLARYGRYDRRILADAASRLRGGAPPHAEELRERSRR